jgi:hypothetical protein
MRQLLPLPNTTGADAKNRTTPGMMYGQFAIFRELGFDSRVNPDRLAGELKWREYW